METKPDTRTRLIDVARDLFWTQGYGATGVADILKGADARSGSLYYFFPTKEDLLLAVLEWYKANLQSEVVQPVFERVSDPIERIFGILDGYRQMLLYTECSHGCPIGNLALELSDSHPQVRKLLAENFTNWKNVIRDCLVAARGRLPEEADCDRLATFVLVSMEGAVMLVRSYRSLEPLEQTVLTLRDYIDRLLADGTHWAKPRRADPPTAAPRRPGRA